MTDYEQLFAEANRRAVVHLLQGLAVLVCGAAFTVWVLL